jgi:hypothetical protein
MYPALSQLPHTARPFVRFVVAADRDEERHCSGLFRHLHWTDDTHAWPAWQRDLAFDALDWFGDELPVPPFRSQGWPRQAVCWFRSDAGRAIRKMWEFAAILREAGLGIRLLRSHDPGRILYFDRDQIVALPRRRIVG